jgi:Family of unknown function (DUF6644)
VAIPYDTLRWIEGTVLSTAIRQSSWAVMALEAVHLVGLAILGGVSVTTAIAAIRRDPRGPSVETLARDLRPLAIGALGLLVASGLPIAMSAPFKYYENAGFRWKMLSLACALLVSGLLVRQSTNPASRLAKIRTALAVLACLCWLAVAVGGRLIGFL